MAAYYNEFDKKTANWLRNLIDRGLIADGVVDDRPIQEVKSSDLIGYEQVHLFAGIGGWSLALRLAGVPDYYPVWTGSCPCQSFSTAGKQKGKNDARHLWPEMFRLISESKPKLIFGEQVEAAIRHGWIDDLQADLEAESYAVGFAILGAHSVNAHHKRQRLYLVADSGTERLQEQQCYSGVSRQAYDGVSRKNITGSGSMGNAEHYGSYSGQDQGSNGSSVQNSQARTDNTREPSGAGSSSSLSMGNANSDGLQSRSETATLDRYRCSFNATDWIECRDGKIRPIESSIQLLAHDVPARLAKLRGIGNAIVPTVASEFISAYFDVIND